MRKIFLTAVLTSVVGLLTAYAQVDEDRSIKTDEERLTQDTLIDSPGEADSAIMKDGEIIEDRLRVDTLGMEMDTINNDMKSPSDRIKNVPKRKSDE